VDAVSIHEAKTHFSRLVARAEAGEEIVVRRGPATRAPGALKGQIDLAEDFDELPADFGDYVP
jgi:Antitoxin Phd_YefM, type II toxin-antitoxin system